MTKSIHVRIDTNFLKAIDILVKKNPLFGNRRKFIELAIIEKLEKTKIKKRGSA